MEVREEGMEVHEETVFLRLNKTNEAHNFSFFWRQLAHRTCVTQRSNSLAFFKITESEKKNFNDSECHIPYPINITP